MPFPLAHPVAVLPFRRYCPRFFSLPALVAGSLVPDYGHPKATLKPPSGYPGTTAGL
jgi:hypothetical protein